MNESVSEIDLLALTAKIVSAHVGKTATDIPTLPALIRSVHTALLQVGTVVEEPAKAKPAVPIKHSVFPDYLVCLEDGKKLKMLKRHLASAYKMTPERYREKWGLPASYPMVAANYAKRRSELAKAIGLGRKPATAQAPRRVAKNASRGKRAPAAAKEA